VHTHTDNTRQPEPQLKSSSCSSAIPSHNSRDVILSHNPRNATCLTLIPSHNLRNTFWATTQGTPASRPSRYHQSLVDHKHPKQQNASLASALSPGLAPKLPSELRFQTAWLWTRTTRHHTPKDPLTYKLRLAEPSSPSGATLIQSPLFLCCRLAGQSPPPRATPVLVQYWF